MEPTLRPADPDGPSAPCPPGHVAAPAGVWQGHWTEVVYDPARHEVAFFRGVGPNQLMAAQLGTCGFSRRASDGSSELWVRDRTDAARAALDQVATARARHQLTAAAVLDRITIAPRPDGTEVVQLDGWPLLLVRRTTGAVAVNDLRRTRAFVARATVPGIRHAVEAMRLELVGPATTAVRVGSLRLAMITVDPMRPTHAEVRVEDPQAGTTLLDVTVRYRQLHTDRNGFPGPGVSSFP